MKDIFNRKTLLFALILMIYFIVCDLLNVADNIELRFFNILILGAGLWYVLYVKALSGKDFGIEYLHGIKTGLEFSFGTAFLFAIMFLIYSAMTGFRLTEALQAQGVIPEAVSTLHLAGVIVFEGLASGFILTLIMMQYLKYSVKGMGRAQFLKDHPNS